MGFMEKTGAWICGEMTNSPFRGRRHWSLGLQQAWGHRSVFYLPLAFIYLFFFFLISLCLNICDIFHQAVNLLETEPELIFIKEEAYDDHPIGQQMSLSDNRKSMSDF